MEQLLSSLSFYFNTKYLSLLFLSFIDKKMCLNFVKKKKKKKREKIDHKKLVFWK